MKALKCKPSAQFDSNIWIENVLGEHNGTKTELYRTNTKSQGLVAAYFALIISIVVHVLNINQY